MFHRPAGCRRSASNIARSVLTSVLPRVKGVEHTRMARQDAKAFLRFTSPYLTHTHTHMRVHSHTRARDERNINLNNVFFGNSFLERRKHITKQPQNSQVHKRVRGISTRP